MIPSEALDDLAVKLLMADGEAEAVLIVLFRPGLAPELISVSTGTDTARARQTLAANLRKCADSLDAGTIAAEYTKTIDPT